MFPLNLLQENKFKPVPHDIETNKARIKKTLAHFGIEVEIVEVNVGPIVTQFILKVQEGIKLFKVIELQNVFAMNLAARTARVEIIDPEESLVGIEIPNETVSLVYLKEVITDNKFKEADSGSLRFAAGKDVSGRNIFIDLVKLPHLLMAGTTGSGKSVFINSIITSLIYNLNPDQLRFVLIDPKRVEFAPYAGMPHLLMPVMTRVGESMSALKAVTDEMERRCKLLEKLNVEDIDSYNNTVQKKEDKLFKIVLIIDELSDLMHCFRVETEVSIIYLLQRGDKVGIHVILSTSRPSVNVFTKLIKENTNSHIAFNVPSQVNSNSVIGELGAEKLLGKGDMLFKRGDESPIRLQASFVSEEEKENIIDFLKRKNGIKKILLFEDEELLANMYKKHFEKEKFQVQNYLQSPEAPQELIDLVLKEKPDLILTNIIMPGMDGFKLTQVLKSDDKTKNIPICALTNMGQSEDRQKGMDLGMTDYFVNSEQSPDELVQKVKSLLKE